MLKGIKGIEIAREKYVGVAQYIVAKQLIFGREVFVNPNKNCVVLLAQRLSVYEVDDAGRVWRREECEDFLRDWIDAADNVASDGLSRENRRARQGAAGWTRKLGFTGRIKQLPRIKVKVCGSAGAAKVDGLAGEKRAEISCLLSRSRHNGGRCLALNQSQRLIAAKKECFVLSNRPAERETKLISDKFRARGAGDFCAGNWICLVEGEKVASVQHLVAEIVPGGAVKLVCS